MLANGTVLRVITHSKLSVINSNPKRLKIPEGDFERFREAGRAERSDTKSQGDRPCAARTPRIKGGHTVERSPSLAKFWICH